MGLDVVTDVRDVFYDLTHWEWTWEHAGQTALDIAGLIPIVGAVKNVDEIGALAKAAGKVDDAVGGAKGVEVAGAGIAGAGIVKRADKAGGGSRELIISKEGGFYRNVAGVGSVKNVDETTGNTGRVKFAGAIGVPGKKVYYSGKTVTQNNKLFNPFAVDEVGRSNVQRMQQGLAPKGYDGKPVNIHHVDQTNNGPVVEISGSAHTQNYTNLHTNTGQSPSQIDRSAFTNWRVDYWRWRAKEFAQP